MPKSMPMIFIITHCVCYVSMWIALIEYEKSIARNEREHKRRVKESEREHEKKNRKKGKMK